MPLSQEEIRRRYQEAFNNEINRYMNENNLIPPAEKNNQLVAFLQKLKTKYFPEQDPLTQAEYQERMQVHLDIINSGLPPDEQLDGSWVQVYSSIAREELNAIEERYQLSIPASAAPSIYKELTAARPLAHSSQIFNPARLTELLTRLWTRLNNFGNKVFSPRTLLVN